MVTKLIVSVLVVAAWAAAFHGGIVYQRRHTPRPEGYMIFSQNEGGMIPLHITKDQKNPLELWCVSDDGYSPCVVYGTRPDGGAIALAPLSLAESH